MSWQKINSKRKLKMIQMASKWTKRMWQEFTSMQGHGQLNYQLLGTFLTKCTIAVKYKLAENKFKKETENDSKWPLCGQKPMWQQFPAMQGHEALNYQLMGTFLTWSTIADAKHKSWFCTFLTKSTIAAKHTWVDKNPCDSNSLKCRDP